MLWESEAPEQSLFDAEIDFVPAEDQVIEIAEELLDPLTVPPPTVQEQFVAPGEQPLALALNDIVELMLPETGPLIVIDAGVEFPTMIANWWEKTFSSEPPRRTLSLGVNVPTDEYVWLVCGVVRPDSSYEPSPFQS